MQTESQDPQPHQTPHPTNPHTNTNGLPMQTEAWDAQMPSVPLFNFQQSLLGSQSCNFGTANQSFQPQNLEMMNFLLHNREPFCEYKKRTW